MKKFFHLWKTNETTGRKDHVSLWGYICVWMFYFGLFGGLTAIELFVKDGLSQITLFSALKEGFWISFKYLAVFYVCMALFGYFYDRAGDSLTKHIYRLFRARRAIKSVDELLIEEETTRSTSCLIVMRTTQIIDGNMKRSLMTIVPDSLIWDREIVFEETDACSIIDPKYMISGYNHTEVTTMLNESSLKHEAIDTLSHCYAFEIVEFSVVYDESDSDNMLKLRIQHYPHVTRTRSRTKRFIPVLVHLYDEERTNRSNKS